MSIRISKLCLNYLPTTERGNQSGFARPRSDNGPLRRVQPPTVSPVCGNPHRIPCRAKESNLHVLPPGRRRAPAKV